MVTTAMQLAAGALRLLRGVDTPGLTVALLGPDGAGKSTIASTVAEAFPGRARILYMGLNDGTLARAAFLRPFVMLGRLFRRYLIGYWHRQHGDLVLFDRYSYDARIRPNRTLTRTDRILRTLRAHSLPAPDLTIVLDAPGAVLHHRSGEYTARILELERQDYCGLKNTVPHVKVLDASAPPAVVALAVLEAIGQRRSTEH